MSLSEGRSNELILEAVLSYYMEDFVPNYLEKKIVLETFLHFLIFFFIEEDVFIY